MRDRKEEQDMALEIEEVEASFEGASISRSWLKLPTSNLPLLRHGIYVVQQGTRVRLVLACHVAKVLHIEAGSGGVAREQVLAIDGYEITGMDD